MKINSKTRVRIQKLIAKEFGVYYWDRYTIRDILKKEYDMYYTSNRHDSYYFQPTNVQKFLLFAIKYGTYIVRKKTKKS